MRSISSIAVAAVLAGTLGACATTQQLEPPLAGEPVDTSRSAEEAAAEATAEALAAGEMSEAMNEAFEEIGGAYIEAYTELNPVSATQLGEHAYDSELPDISAQGRATTLAVNKALLTALDSLDRSALTPDNQVDAALLENELRYQIWQIEEYQPWAWNPQYYNDIASYSLYSMIARDFAPWPERFANIVARMEKLPAFLETARAQIDVARVPKVHAETVAAQNAGIMEIVDAALLPEVESSGVDRTRFDAALGNLKAALAEHQTWLDEVLVPNAAGEFRMGEALYDQKMRFALMSQMTRPELKARAEQAFRETRAEMYDLAREVVAARVEGAQDFPDDPPPHTQQQVIELALSYSYAERPARAELEQRARETLAQATAFTREQGFVRMPEGAVQVITMPKFWQGNAVAYDDAPGALERHLPNYYAVSPIPEEWTDEQATSFLTEYNTYMLHDLSIHEGVPGHYLQLDHANRHDSVLRAVLGSGPFIEGWAVYSERVMSELDYLDGDPLFKLTVLKMRLRSIINTLLDIGIHTEGMTREEAMTLMMQGGFQQEREAAGKWTRANLSSVQLLSYFTGYAEHSALRQEAERRWGDAFTLRRYHDEVLSHGSPPVKYVRALMFDLPVE